MIPNVVTHVVLRTNIKFYRMESKIILLVFSPQNEDVGNSFINTFCHMITKLIVILFCHKEEEAIMPLQGLNLTFQFLLHVEILI
jgi:hypothetical protein